MSAPPSLPGVTHEWIDAGGLRTHVALAGPHDAPPLLLVHGWPQHWWAWRHVIAELSTEFRIVAPDLRGHGWTDAPREGYAKEQLATDLLALLDALGLEKVVWAGHDWGAWTGILAALRAPERFERLLATCIPPPFSTRRDPRTLALALGYQGPISTPLLGSAIVRAGFAGQLLKRGRARGEFSPEEVAVYDDVFRARPHVTVGMYRTFLTREALGVAKGRYASQTVQVPTTMLLGDRDLITRAIPAGPYEGQPNVTVERVPNVGHFLLEEDPDAVVAALRRP
ncbi:MAG: alpha/beta fold hydrolase [Solirubrobacteraceae bacterium]